MHYNRASIIGGNRYDFRLRSAQVNGALLASVTVTTEAPVPLTYADFAPYKARHGGQIGNASGGIYSQWASLPYSADRIDIAWGSPSNWDCASGSQGCPTKEEHGIRRDCSPHGDLVWLYAYRNDHIGHRYRIRTTRALLIRGGQTHDITGQCGLEGQPYALANDVGAAYTMKVWGDILNNDGVFSQRFYWEHRITPPASTPNVCWKGSGASTRAALRQDELWWDSANGWVIGGGQMGANGEPNGAGSWYGRYQTMARDTGFGWTLGTRTTPGGAWQPSCLYYQWNW